MHFNIKILSIIRLPIVLIFAGLSGIPSLWAADNSGVERAGHENDLQVPQVPQRFVVTGKVTDEAGDPLGGVNVFLKDTTTGTVTGGNGEYSINVSGSGAILVFSSIGYATQELPVGARVVVDCQMKEGVAQIDQVVVIAYGTQKKATLTGALSSIGGDDILKAPVPNLGHALAGQLPGLSAIQYSGQPGADDPTIFIRGIGSLDRTRSAPLIMVDGVERSFFQLDPNEVESISILKDASATAVFGVRGANGVILVTTKRGQVGKPKISFSTSFGMQRPIRLLDFTGSYEYALMYNEGERNDGIAEEMLSFKPNVVEAFRTNSDPLLYPNTDWMDMIIKPSAMQTQHNFNVSGGTDRVKYFVSVGVLTQDGIFRSFDNSYNANFKYNRYNYRGNVDVGVTSSTTLRINLGGRIEDRHSPNVKENRLYQGLTWSIPFAGVGLYEGKWVRNHSDNVPTTDMALSNGDAFEYFYGRGFSDAVTNVVNLDLQLTQKLDFVTKGLSFAVKGSYNSGYTHTKNRNKYLRPYTAHRDSTGELYFRKPEQNQESTVFGFSESTGQSRDWSLEGSLNYSRGFGRHNISALALYNQWQNTYPGGSFPGIPKRYVGLVGRVTYEYDMRYLLDINMGYNGSENFANRYGFFPAVSAGWIISEEKFMEGAGFIDYLKVRASYGLVGNDIYSGGRFFYLPDAYNPDAGPGAGNTGRDPWGYNFGTTVSTIHRYAREYRIGNSDVTWEKARKQNYGIDFTFLKSRLSGSFDYFIEKRDDILTTKNTIPAFVALQTLMPVVNIGVVENRGYEVALKWEHGIRDFRYHIGANVSFARNKVIYKDEIPHKYPWQYETGRPVGQQFGYIFDGLVTEADIVAGDIPDHNIVLKPGDAKYVDRNEDGRIDSEDIGAIGYPSYPELTGGITAGFGYKGFDFSMLWTGATMVSRFLDEAVRTPFTTSRTRGLMQYLYDERWTPETAATATLPRMSWNNLMNNYDRASTLNLRDASYLRLKNVQVGYTFSGSWLDKLGLDKMRVYATGENLLTFDKLKISDPESQNGSDYRYPLLMIFNIGLSLTFK